MDAPTDSTGDLSLDELVELERRAAEPPDGPIGGGGGGGDDDDVVVLSWWQHPVNIVTMVVTAALLAAMIGWMVGDTRSELSHNEVDTGFLQDMRVHHEQAVLMSFIYRNLPDTDPGMRTIAASILRGQNIEVGRMIQLLRLFGESEINESDVAMLWMGMSADPEGMPGMATDDELDRLGRASGEEADRLFVELMTEHHVGGVEMAEFAAENGANDEVRRMAAAMAAAQRSEIDEMAHHLD